jgi:hypothetical protein
MRKNKLIKRAKAKVTLLTVKCPFCGNKIKKLYATTNAFCNCGAKYYAMDKLWLNRKTGETVYETSGKRIGQTC